MTPTLSFAALEGLDLPRELRRGGDRAEDSAGAVQAFLRSADECKKIGTLGRTWVQESHDWARTLTPILDLVENRGENEGMHGHP